MMNNFRFKSGLGLGFVLLFILNTGLVIMAVITHDHLLIGCGILLSYFQCYLLNQFRQKSRVLRNYPYQIILKDFLDFIPGKLSRLFFKNDALRCLLNDRQREILARRSKNRLIPVVQDNLFNQQDPGFEYVQTHNTLSGTHHKELRVEVGTEQCSRPYSLSVLNFGIPDTIGLNKKCRHAVSQAANMRNCAVHSGGVSLSPELIRGGSDLIWQIRYDNCFFRNDDRSLNEARIKAIALKPYVKMIEIKFQPDNIQADKQGLTAFAVFSFVKKLRSLSEGKPVGIYLSNPGKEIINRWGNAMVASGVHFDFITIDNTYSKRALFQNKEAYQHRFFEALWTARNMVDRCRLRTRIVAAGIILTEYDLLRVAALGADACVNASSAIMAASSIRDRFAPCLQSVRLSNFHRNTMEATSTLMRLCRYQKFSDANPSDFLRRINGLEIRSLKDIVDPADAPTADAQYMHLN